jgi:modulator of FtsH protease
MNTINTLEKSYSTNTVVRQTYMLLSMTLLTSAATALVSMWLQLGYGASLIFSLVGLGMIFFLRKAARSSWALVFVFAFTAIEGLSLGPIINHYLHMENGASVVMQALGGTGAIFLVLSGYALTSKKDFSFLGGFLFTGLIVLIVASIAGMFFNVPAMQLAIAAAGVMIFSGFILYDTSRIINGGETNYVIATIELYLDILNLFLSLLRLLSNRK